MQSLKHREPYQVRFQEVKNCGDLGGIRALLPDFFFAANVLQVCFCGLSTTLGEIYARGDIEPAFAKTHQLPTPKDAPSD